MSKFNPGDRVVCVDQGLSGKIFEGKVYTVVRADHGYVTISDADGLDLTFFDSRFKLVESAPTLGVAFRVRSVTVFEASADGGKTWVPVPDPTALPVTK